MNYKIQQVRFKSHLIPKCVTGKVTIINGKLVIDTKSYLLMNGVFDDFSNFNLNDDNYHYLNDLVNEIYVPCEFEFIIDLNEVKY